MWLCYHIGGRQASQGLGAQNLEEEMSWILMMMLGCGADENKAKDVGEAVTSQSGADKRARAEERERKQIAREEKKRAKSDKIRAARSAKAAELRPQLGIEEGGKLAAVFVTSMGKVRCKLLPEVAPVTVLNFVQLAEGGKEWTHPKTKAKSDKALYSGTLFHRVIPNFMIQGGDPMGTGRGGPGYRFEDEPHPDYSFDKPGLLAMANSGPNTNGSQFFITDRSKPAHLNGKHTIFGVCKNLDVVEAIATAAAPSGNRPAEDIVLKTVKIKR
jgi:peptidyl-prolyl cis-trans isomerase A (cyclophilin A)